MKLLTPPPPRTKTKDLFINLRFNYFKVFILRVESFFRLFEPRPKEGKKLKIQKEPQRRPYFINFPLSQSYHSLRASFEFWEKGRTAGGEMIKLK